MNFKDDKDYAIKFKIEKIFFNRNLIFKNIINFN